MDECPPFLLDSGPRQWWIIPFGTRNLLVTISCSACHHPEHWHQESNGYPVCLGSDCRCRWEPET